VPLADLGPRLMRRLWKDAQFLVADAAAITRPINPSIINKQTKILIQPIHQQQQQQQHHTTHAPLGFRTLSLDRGYLSVALMSSAHPVLLLNFGPSINRSRSRSNTINKQTKQNKNNTCDAPGHFRGCLCMLHWVSETSHWTAATLTA